MSEPNICECSLCGWQWEWGTNGNHNCGTVLKARCNELESELKPPQTPPDQLTRMRIERAALLAEIERLRAENLRLEREMNQLRCARK